MENLPRDHWAYSFTFLYQILIRNQWKVLLEIRGPIPLSFLIKSLLNLYQKSMENTPGPQWTYYQHFSIKSLSETN